MADLQEAQSMVTRLRAERDDARAAGGQLLVSPYCHEGCPRCVRGCAVKTILLKWWEEELDRATPSNVIPFPIHQRVRHCA